MYVFVNTNFRTKCMYFFKFRTAIHLELVKLLVLKTISECLHHLKFTGCTINHCWVVILAVQMIWSSLYKYLKLYCINLRQNVDC
jgi:hypothetical protein